MDEDSTAPLGNLFQCLTLFIMFPWKHFPIFKGKILVFQFMHMFIIAVTGHDREEPGSVAFTPLPQLFMYID